LGTQQFHGVTGYNVYRASVSGGPYTKVNPALVVGTTYTDSNVQAGQSYFYVTTALNGNGTESTYSNQVQATVPSP
jgi:fibronectin type 3 domain-containing protein